jgi:uncharacterized protein YjbI with pentapeptide repeats
MNKIIALAVLMMAAQFAAPIHAQTNSPSGKPQVHSLQFNGARMNGVSLNGRSLNGRTLNGKLFNGTKFNGNRFNSAKLNGFRWNGSAFAQSEQSPLSGILLEQVKVLNSPAASTPQH